MTKDTSTILDLYDEPLDAPEQQMNFVCMICCAPCLCGCATPPPGCTVSDEALDAPTQHAIPVCGGAKYYCQVSDEALDAPTQHAGYCHCGPPPPSCLPSSISDEALDAPTQEAITCGGGFCYSCGISDETHATV